MRVRKHSCDITRILIGSVLSDARFDWLVGNIWACIKKICFDQQLKKNSISFICRIIFEKYFIKATVEFNVSETASRVCITVSNSPNSPSCLDEAM